MKNLFNTIIKISLISSSLFLSALSSTSFANYDYRCDYLSGTWTGEGTLKWHGLNCRYLSVARVTAGNPGVAEVSVAKSSGPFLCPNMDNQLVKVYCHNGVVTLQDKKINVVGELSDDVRFIQFTGTLLSRVHNYPFILSVAKAG